MPRLIVPILAILVVGAVLVPGRPSPPPPARPAPPPAHPARPRARRRTRRWSAATTRRPTTGAIQRSSMSSSPTISSATTWPSRSRTRHPAPPMTSRASRRGWPPSRTCSITIEESVRRRRHGGGSSQVWSGTQEGPFPQWDAPATGRPMARESLVVWRVECGQLAENWIVQDNLTMLRQLGIITDDELATAGTPTVATPEP